MIKKLPVVVSVEGPPAAVPALHADDPAPCLLDGLSVLRPTVAVKQHGDDGRVVDVRIVVIAVLERPAAGPQIRSGFRPVASHLGDLAGHQPVTGSVQVLLGVDAATPACLNHCMA